MKRLFNYIEPMWLGSDGKVSGRRFLAILLALSSMILSFYGVLNCLEHIESIAMLVGTLLAGSGMYWGITAWQDLNIGKAKITEQKVEPLPQ